ncbi:MAG: hypothetical protein COA73_10990 [Candidatus Hydrogenedentota bacterium]|nr:MAG: hypothetical protein COA73_10990 [Candidatus Hydrogenedentota bacterium]
MKTKLLSSAFAFLAGCVVMSFTIGDNDNTVIAQESQAKEAAADERLFMLNVLWFKEDGGAEKYMEYMKAAGPFVAKYGGKSDQAYVPVANMIGEFDADLIFFVEWPNRAAFLGLVQDPEYKKISHLRGEAIVDSLLIQCSPMDAAGLGE